MSPERRALVRGIAGLLALTMLWQFGPAYGAPGDIFTSAAPTIGAEPPKARDVKDGDASVSTQTGALQYAYPIQVPPGRGGMAPQLALSYSSQAPIYGGIAAGWSLSIPEIREDGSMSRLRFRSPEVEDGQTDPKADDRFVSSMAGGRPLVKVTEPAGAGVYATYRAQNDATFARYQRMLLGQPFRWRVLTTDGKVMTFGDTSAMFGIASPIGSCAGLIDEQYAPLTRVEDAFGNAVVYEYEQVVTGECRIRRISWGYNAAAGLDRVAEVNFGYQNTATCVSPTIAPGSQRELRTGILHVTGASELGSIVATAYAPHASSASHTRQILLGYDRTTVSCSSPNAAPHRRLERLQESAWGVDMPRVDLPPVTFGYGAATNLSLARSGQASPWADPFGTGRPNNLAWGYRRNDDRWPTVEAMMLDIDGDGRLDRLTNSSSSSPATITECSARWQKNMGEVAEQVVFSTPIPSTIPLPRLKWRGTSSRASQAIGGAASAFRGAPSFEGCALNGQVTAYQNSVEVFTNGCHVPASTPPFDPSRSCSLGTDPANDNQFCFPGGTECPAGEGGPASNDFRTYLAYRWLDMDADGLVDLVAAVHGDIDAYDIERGNLIESVSGVEKDYRGGEPSISGIPGLGQWPACPGQQDRCKSVGTCMDAARVCTEAGCTIDWTQIASCVAQPATTQGCATIMAGPAGGGVPIAPTTRGAYSRCEGLYPWLIYRNRGNGVFATQPLIKYQPIPLESDSGDSAITGPGQASQRHAVMDFDGDGILDAIAHGLENPQNPQPDAWQVWLGDGTGGFLPKRYMFPTRRAADGSGYANYISGTGTQPTPGLAASSVGLIDVNGDGLSDQWMALAGGNANIALNRGDQHYLTGADPASTGELTTTVPVKPGNDASYLISEADGTNRPLAGTSKATVRTLDVDGDGRVDVVRNPSSPTVSPTVHFNVGGQFIVRSDQPAFPGTGVGPAVDRATAVERIGYPVVPGSASDANEESRWELLADLVDLDGNGVTEAAMFAGATLTRVVESATTPPRLLTSVTNGHGLITTITYTHMHDATTVTQAPTDMWGDVPCPVPAPAGWTEPCRPKTSPRTQWVVRSIRNEDVQAGTDAATTQAYAFPRFAKDDEGRYGFRGFERVTTTGPSGARTIQRYDYVVDWSGRLAAELVLPAQGAGETTVADEVRSMRRLTWEPRTLFGGAVTTYHQTVSDQFTCRNGQAEDGCESNPAAFVRTTTTLKDYASHSVGGGPALLWQEIATRLQAQASPADGDRITSTEPYVFSSGTTYRVRSIAGVRQHQLGGALVTIGRSAQTWDADYRVPVTSETWLNGDDADRAITEMEYDLTTGNLVKQRKPVQVATSGPAAEFAYDPHKLFVVSAFNELGHGETYGWEYGTGTKVLTDGPNQRTCVTNTTTCILDATHPLREQAVLKLDGLGRVLERWGTYSNDASVYTLYKVETNAYTDTPVTGAGSSVLHRQLVNTFETIWTQDKTELDAHGRPLKTTVYVQGSAPFDQITSYEYNATGTLARVNVPNPSISSAATVAYTYTYDSLGRPTTIRRPDAALAKASGVNLRYDGLTTTSVEETGLVGALEAGGGAEAESQRRTDAFGRLVEVQERTGPSTWATTTYGYGPDDLVTSVVDPQGVTTTMVHDLGGRRTQITRHGRVWDYTYDRNGNLASETVPGWTALTQADYTSSIVYDALDRPTSKLIGPRAMSIDDQNLFGAFREAFVYDTGNGMKGRLRTWTAYDRTNVSVNVRAYTADAQGNPVTTAGSFRGAGYAPHGRSITEGWSAHGARRYVDFGDPMGGVDYRTFALTSFDPRGMPTSTTVLDFSFTLTPTTRSTRVVGTQTRNVAGLVTKRSSNLTSGVIDSLWTYDVLGRVTQQQVTKSIGGQVALQQLTYLGNDNPSTLVHQLGTGTARTFTYEFDQRHQLTEVTTNIASYFAAFYQYGTSGRFTRATEGQSINPLPPKSEIKPRDVTYVYGGTDPEQVTQLTIASGTGAGQAYATYTYDAAGNMLTRSYPATGENWQFVYDGKDQLRRATRRINTAVQGSEEYWYDGSGQRTQIVKRDSANTKTELVWFLKDVQAHYNGTGALTRIYSNITLGTPVARVERIGSTAPAFEFQFHGLASSTLAAVDIGGTVNASFSYAPFGAVLEATDAGGAATGVAAHKRRFNDKYVDDVSSLAYYGARYYDRMLMGWTQADPLYLRLPDLSKLSTPRRSNLGVFSLNNPMRYIDPDGLDAGNVSGYIAEIDAVNESRALRESIEVHNQVAGLISDLFSARGGVKATHARSPGAGAPPLTRKQAEALAGIVYTSLLMSESFRAVFSSLMSEGSHAVFLALTDSGETSTIPNTVGAGDMSPNNGIGADSYIFYNPDDGGKGSINGQNVVIDPYSKLAHEFSHASDQVSGTQSLDRSVREQKATNFENTFRREAMNSSFAVGRQMGTRDCYRPPCSAAGPRKQSASQ